MTPRTSILAASVSAALAAAHITFRQATRTWGASYAEAEQPLPGDELVPNPVSQATMAVTIDAPLEAVWPWLVQMGVDRAGLYTHTWVENGIFRLQVKNADRIVPEWQNLTVGDHIWFTRGDDPNTRIGPLVTALEPNRALIFSLGDDPARRFGTWQFILQPLGPAATRLLFRSRSSPTRPLGLKAFDLICEPGYLYMDIGMLHGIKVRAERAAKAARPSVPNPVLTETGRTVTALVAVSSFQGSTRQIAKAIAAALRAKGIAAEVRDAGEVVDVSRYDAVVLGSAIHTHHWLQDARQFVERHGAALRARPIWLFSSGMLAIDTGAPWPAGYPQGIDQFMATTKALGHTVFAGRREMREPKFLWNLMAKGPVWSIITKVNHVPKEYHLTLGDYRDWDAIRAWADEIGAALQSQARRVAA